MIKLRWEQGCEPEYQSEASAAADLKARLDMVIPAGEKAKVPTGVWIEQVLWDKLPEGIIPELQVRARSGLAYKHGLTLSNGVGTIDADFPDEICVLLWNTSSQDFSIQKGDRIAQLLLSLCHRIPELNIKGKRLGGFGSTGLRTEGGALVP